MDLEKKPVLTEPGVKHFLGETLKQCRISKQSYIDMMVNVSLFVLFCSILGGLLYYKRTGKPTVAEKKENLKKQQEYILSKLQMVQVAKRRQRQDLITGLPCFKSEFEVLNRKLYS